MIHLILGLLFSFSVFGQVKFSHLSLGVLKVCAATRDRLLCHPIGSGSSYSDDFFPSSQYQGESWYVDGLENLRHVSSISGLTCFLDDLGPSCFGEGDMSIHFPVNERPDSLKAIASQGQLYACVWDKESLRCFGKKELVKEIPLRAELTQMEENDYLECGLSEGRIFCWRNQAGLSLSYLSSLRGITEFYLQEKSICVVMYKRVECLGELSHLSMSFDQLGVSEIKDFALGSRHACAIAPEGVKCWGSNSFGQLDLPEDLGEAKVIEASDMATCILNTESSIRCWGGEKLDYLFQPFPGDVQVAELTVLEGSDLFCYLNQGKIVCPPVFKSPKEWDQEKYSKIFYYSKNICALKDEKIFCWDYLGNALITPYTALTEVREVWARSSNYESILCARYGRAFKCWGAQSPEVPELVVPEDLGMPEQLYVSVDKGYQQRRTGCAILEGGKLRCFGNYADYFSKIIPPGLKDVKEVKFKNSSLVYLDQQNKVVGLSSDLKDVPQNLGRVRHFTVGDQFACAADEITLECWGDRNGPLDPPKDLDVKSIRKLDSFDSTVCAEGNFGVRCWGKRADRINYYFNNPLFQ